jgi:hypothetical protein
VSYPKQGIKYLVIEKGESITILHYSKAEAESGDQPMKEKVV